MGMGTWSWVLLVVAGCWVLGVMAWVLGLGSWLLFAGCRLLGDGSWGLGLWFGRLVLGLGLEVRCWVLGV